jgi:hypothetical protein
MLFTPITPGEATDPLFANLIEPSCEQMRKRREFIESLWLDFEDLADRHFKTEIRTRFSPRFWELYLGSAFKVFAKEFNWEISSEDDGPDILIHNGSQRIWIEAITLTNGEQGKNSFVPAETESGWIPDDQIISRFTSALESKHAQYQKYLEKSLIGPEDAFIIAFNASSLYFQRIVARDDVPRFIKAVLPIGPFQVTIDRATRQILGTGNASRFEIQRQNAGSIPVSAFLKDSYSGISALMCSHADLNYFDHPLGIDFQVLHNPKSRNPIPQGMIRWFREWSVEINQFGGTLNCRSRVYD